MSAPIKVTDLVSKSLEELTRANSAPAAEAARLERNARVYADLAGVQSAKTANVISYLNSDRSAWSETDEKVVRVMLGLHALSGDGGIETDAADEPEPLPEPEAAAVGDAEPVVEVATVDEPEPVPALVEHEVEEPTFA